MILFVDLQGGLKCHSNELLKAFVLGLSKQIKEEKAVYGQISDEEWEVIRLTKRERRDSILKFVENYLEQTSKCANCTTWKVESAEIWGDQYDDAQTFSDVEMNTTSYKASLDRKLTQAGFWKPTNGLRLTDVLFPHVSHGFRNQTFEIFTYHVRHFQALNSPLVLYIMEISEPTLANYIFQREHG